MSKNSKEAGQSLVEVIIALGVLMVVVVGFTNLILTSLQNAQYARSQEEANQHLRNTIEIIRVVRDQNEPIARQSGGTVDWSTVWGGTDNYSLNRCYRVSPVEDFPNYILEETSTNCTNANKNQIGTTRFTREIKFTDLAGGFTQTSRTFFNVRVTVEWIDAKGPHTAELTTTIARLQ